MTNFINDVSFYQVTLMKTCILFLLAHFLPIWPTNNAPPSLSLRPLIKDTSQVSKISLNSSLLILPTMIGDTMIEAGGAALMEEGISVDYYCLLSI